MNLSHALGSRRCAVDVVGLVHQRIALFSRVALFADEPALPPLLRPVALDLLDEQHARAVSGAALIEADVREDVGLVEVGGLEIPATIDPGPNTIDDLAEVLGLLRLGQAAPFVVQALLLVERAAKAVVVGYTILARPPYEPAVLSADGFRQRQQQLAVVLAAGELVFVVLGLAASCPVIPILIRGPQILHEPNVLAILDCLELGCRKISSSCVERIFTRADVREFLGGHEVLDQSILGLDQSRLIVEDKLHLLHAHAVLREVRLDLVARQLEARRREHVDVVIEAAPLHLFRRERAVFRARGEPHLELAHRHVASLRPRRLLEPGIEARVPQRLGNRRLRLELARTLRRIFERILDGHSFGSSGLPEWYVCSSDFSSFSIPSSCVRKDFVYGLSGPKRFSALFSASSSHCFCVDIVFLLRDDQGVVVEQLRQSHAGVVVHHLLDDLLELLSFRGDDVGHGLLVAARQRGSVRAAEPNLELGNVLDPDAVELAGLDPAGAL